MNNPPSKSEMSDQRQEESTRNGTVDVDPASSSSAQVRRTTPPAHLGHDANQDLLAAIPTVSAQQQHNEGFTTYNSPFKFYPLLYLRSQPGRNSNSSLRTSSSPSSLVSSSNSPTSLRASSFGCLSSPSLPCSFQFALASAYSIFPNLKLLRLATVSKLLDPLRPICQYEIPGGGICRDAGCADVHLNLLTGHDGNGGVEPSDQETAEYLADTLPVEWLAEHVVSPTKISSTLRQIHIKNPQMVFEERVKEALNMLGATPPPTPP